ncbi:MAG: hypothetical protein ACLFUF_01460 [Opitutales bacterium]
MSPARIQLLPSFLVFLLCSTAPLSAGSGAAEVPRFMEEPMHTQNRAAVREVVSSLATDVVILNGGLQQGLRLGMLCTVARGQKGSFAELIIIEARRTQAAALIIDINKNATIREGDIARIKTT